MRKMEMELLQIRRGTRVGESREGREGKGWKRIKMSYVYMQIHARSV